MRTLAPVAAVAAFFVCVVGVPCNGADAPLDKSNRRDRASPELVLNAGGRTGHCDNLRFTPDGTQLLAVGDDKVVHVWSFADGKIDPASVRELRWGIWREQRGSIYAMAISPDGKRVAIGGLGALLPTVAVLEIATGKVLDLVVAPNDPKFRDLGGFWTVAFSDSGDRVAVGGGDGSVWLWDLKSHALRLLGKPDSDRMFNTVRLLRFTDEDHFLSLSEDEQLRKWSTDGGAPTVIDLKIPARVFRAEISRDGKWLAAAVKGPMIAVRSLDGGEARDIHLKGYDKDPSLWPHDSEFARALAFDPDGSRLAVAVGSFVPGSIGLDADDRLVFYDVTRNQPTASDGPSHTYRADRLTFDPTGKFLAVAGGDNHEVTLWKPANPTKPVSVLRAVGSCLWDVALSADGRLGLRDQRNPTSIDPNARAKGPWRVFDLPRRLWVPADDFKPVPRLATSGGWTVEPDPKDPYVWYAVHASGVRHALPLDRDRDNMPRCYTFLDAKGDRPVRLVVGHYWGFSIFDLTQNEARRTRLCIGHAGEVTALAPSADQTWLVACSDDMTVSAWSLTEDWPSQSILGASFRPEDDHLVVTGVDIGSPAWEAGLVVHDKVRGFAFGGRMMPNDPAKWLERLTQPEPGKEHAFDVERDGVNVTNNMKAPIITTVKQRPLWRFFAAGDEWVLWMWRYSYYDSSAGGDRFLGWHVNGLNPKDAPVFYPLDRFSEHFHRTGVIKRLIHSRDPQEVIAALQKDLPPLDFGAHEPPAAKLEPTTDVTQGQDVPATLSIWSRDDNPDRVPVRAEVWINDFRYQLETSKDLDGDGWTKTDQSEKGQTRTRQLTIPYAKLRAGRNVVTFQTWNRLGGRSDSAAVVKCLREKPEKPQLVGLAVGIDRYNAAKAGGGGKGFPTNLQEAVHDADALHQAWKEQEKFFAAQDPKNPKFLKLLNQAATRDAILDALDQLKTADPDDCCIIFLSGHGYGWTEPPLKPGDPDRDFFAFCLPDFDTDHPYKTGVTSDVLFEKLAAIPCRKLVILDACHSGSVASEDGQLRMLAPQGQGPVVLAACDRSQESVETANPAIDHGLFTFALLEALGGKVSAADRQGRLDVKDVYQYTHDRLPQLLVLVGRREGEQIPQLWSPQGDDFFVAKK